MATEQYFIIVPDRPGAPRLQVRSEHLAKVANEDPAVSKTVFGGAYLTSQPETLDPAAWGFAGSAMMLEFPAGSGEEAVWNWLRTDPYTTGGVWDAEKARIVKFRAGLSNQKDLPAAK
ncbi:hypothetical protein DRE_04866 [Drechslerella stenobrocha 248]|uniref:YCII-related domain-containing protein n=1 Tax=Drechslerella stenobrocha 248 TaxID=1043628 RepID=W7HRN0_9PEZI|nr:hypothetical protein DRE_04866 [Drechslerella stenobrocha 248]